MSKREIADEIRRLEEVAARCPLLTALYAHIEDALPKIDDAKDRHMLEILLVGLGAQADHGSEITEAYDREMRWILKGLADTA